MKRQSAVFLTAICVTSALAIPRAGAEPAWGWRPDEVAHYKQLIKPKSSGAQNAWDAAIVAAPASPALKGVKSPAPTPTPETSATVKAYCQNIEDAALDARFLHQKSELQHLEGELEKRTSALEAKRAEYQDWLKRRDEFIAKAEGSLVELYSKIKPDAAALQLAAIDEEAAAALLLKLNARNSSAILNQMDSIKAARLVSVMIGAAKPQEKAGAQESSAAPEKAAAQDAPQAQQAGNEQAPEQHQAPEKKL
ncbi:MAG: hypothetical protein WCC96_10405 [Rhodomicrobium sp.]